MDRDALVLGVAAVFAGIAVVMGVLAFTRSLFLLFVALPFAVTAYLMWYQATGRLQSRVAERERRAGPTDARTGPRESRSRFGREARERVRGEATGRRTRAGRRGGTAPPPTGTGMTRAEASSELGVAPDASPGEITRAYRERVKEVHPDSGGDEEAFKRVNRAYETLRE